METCDALIVGGGPAGSACASHLYQQGMDVMVMDKANFPRQKVCAGWITPAVLRTLKIPVQSYALSNVLQPIQGFQTGPVNGSCVTTEYSTTVSYGIRRCEFDHYLLRRSGAQLRLGQKVNSLRRKNGYWIVNEAVTTPMLIGAGGHFCPVARYLGAEVGAGERAIAAKEAEFEMSEAQSDACPITGTRPELYFLTDIAGYGWCFRKGRYLNIGLGTNRPGRLSAALDNFCRQLQGLGRIPADMQQRFRGHAYLRYGDSTRTLIGNGVLLIGDAAGLAYPQSGEGILPAIESGLLAGTTIIEADDNYQRQRLASYGQRLLERFGPPTPTAEGVGAELTRRLLTPLLLGNRWFSRHVLLDRWFLHGHSADLLTN